MSTEIDFIDTYTCPHCRADLVLWIRWLVGVAAMPGLRTRIPSARARRASLCP